jgi:hypothetical protein
LLLLLLLILVVVLVEEAGVEIIVLDKIVESDTYEQDIDEFDDENFLCESGGVNNNCKFEFE